MDLSVEDVSASLADFTARLEIVRMAGGVAVMDVVNGVATVPTGWILDDYTQFYVQSTLFSGVGSA